MSSTVRIAVAGKLNGIDELRNVFTVQDGSSTVPTSSSVAAWITAMYTTSGLLGALSNRVHFDRFIVEIPVGINKWQYTYETALNLTGGLSSDSMPQQVAAVVVGITASRRRGKKFISGISEGNVTNGQLNSDFITILQAFGNTWIAGFMDGANQWNAGVCKAGGTDFLQFTSARVDLLTGTQRRRKPGVGS